MKTFFYAILFVTLFMAGQASAFSELKCISNNSVHYTNSNKVGGAHPFPGMVIGVEELQIGDDIAYRLVTRQSCESHPDCVPQQPELQDILPGGFTFGFYPDTKVSLVLEGSSHGPEIHEVYAVQFHVSRQPNIWMLCDYHLVMAP